MKKVVIVDDNKMLLEILNDFIEILGDFKCEAFFKPKEALRYILTEKDIFAVISDYEMSEMNGFKLAKQIIEERPEIKMFVMSGYETGDLKKLAAKDDIDVSKVVLMCKSKMINLMELLNN